MNSTYLNFIGYQKVTSNLWKKKGQKKKKKWTQTNGMWTEKLKDFKTLQKQNQSSNKVASWKFKRIRSKRMIIMIQKGTKNHCFKMCLKK